jgi:hypothetical protein
VLSAGLLWLGCQSGVTETGVVVAEPPAGGVADVGPSAEPRPDPQPPSLAARPKDFEERPELREAYQNCDQFSGQEAKDCVYHLWQSELMALRPGSDSSEEALDAVRRVFFAHREPALARNPQFEERFWAWFWGAWWKEQPRSSWGNPEGCLVFPNTSDQEECLRYADRAWDWLVGRKIQVAPTP